MKIALVHDYLREYGGAERVVEALHELWPSAPLYTSFVDWKSLGIHADRFKNWDIRTSWVQKCWPVKKWHSPLRFLTPLVWKYFDFSEFDVVISSSGWFISRGITVKKPAIHISYIHHPPRNLYGYATGSFVKHPMVRAYATVINPFLRYYDFEAARRVDYLIANSKETARRIRKFYRRDATVVYPPIQGPTSAAGATRGQALRGYFLSVGRLTYAKHVDLIVETCLKLKKKLIVVGDGKDRVSLTSNFQFPISNKHIKFLGSVDDNELAKLYAGAKALIFAAEDEDFGMVPVEAMAFGTPVIAYRSGGVKESVVDGKTGLFFDALTIDSLSSAIKHFNNLIYRSGRRNGKKSKSERNKTIETISRACRRQASKFSKARFKNEMKEFVRKRRELD